MFEFELDLWICSEEEGKSGHHDKEKHESEFDEKIGHKKKHQDESGYHEKNEEAKRGKKGFAFHEEGSFKKGHSTKGKHVIHKLDESKKDKKFFEEDENEDYDEKHGDFSEQHGSNKGGSHKKTHHKSEFDHGEGGKKSHSKKERHHHDESGNVEIDWYFCLLICLWFSKCNYNDTLQFQQMNNPFLVFLISIQFFGNHRLTGHKGSNGHAKHYGDKSEHGKKSGADHHKNWNHKKVH